MFIGQAYACCFTEPQNSFFKEEPGCCLSNKLARRNDIEDDLKLVHVFVELARGVVRLGLLDQLCTKWEKYVPF